MHFLRALKFCDVTRLLFHFVLEHLLEGEKSGSISEIATDSEVLLLLLNDMVACGEIFFQSPS